MIASSHNPVGGRGSLLPPQLLPLLALSLLPPPPRCAALDNGLARTPPMGFNTWNGLQDNYNESVIVEVIDRMAAQLLPFGYEYVVLTEQGMPTTGPHGTGPRRANDTVFRVDEPRFPSGMRFLAQHAHRRGMKFGLYTSGSRITCEQRWGSLYHEPADAALFAEWEIDWVWYDECSESHLSQRAKIGAMSQALNRTGRPMVFQCCPFARLPTAGYNALCNNRRTTEDIDPSWRTILRNLDGNDAWADYAEVGAWNDADMLEVGNGKLSVEEWRSHFTLWALMKTPLQLGLDPRHIMDAVRQIITNEEVIGWNQDDLGVQGRKLATFNSSLGELTTDLVLAACIQGETAARPQHALRSRQVFRFSESDGTIRTADGRCITALGGASAAAKGFAPAVAAPCTAAADQRWRFLNGTGTLGQLVLSDVPSLCLRTEAQPNAVFYPYPPQPSGLGLDPPNRRMNDSVVVGLCEPEPPCPVSQSSFVERACTHVRPPQHWLLLGDNLLPTSGRFDHYEYFNPPEAPYGLDSWSDDHELCLSLGLEGDHQVWGGPLRDGKVAVTLLNRGNATASITAFASALSLSPVGGYAAFDAWQNASLGSVDSSNLTLEVGPHAVRAVTLTPHKSDDEARRQELAPAWPGWSWAHPRTFCFPGGYHPASGCSPSYTAADREDYAKFDLVLVQGQNFTKFSNGSWRATQEAETAKFASAMNRTVFPYIAWYAPQAWYEAQARFNDPETRWEEMWLRDSQGRLVSMHGGAAGPACSDSTTEGADYKQYRWRRIYDWRKPAARDFMTQQVVRFILENPLIGGAFFDDVSSVASFDVQCGCPNCKCQCGNFTPADREDFLNNTLVAVEQLLATFARHGKLPILSTEDGASYGICADAGPDCNPYARSFTMRTMALLRRYGGFRFVESLGEIGIDWPKNTTSAAAILANDIRFLLGPEAAATPHLIHVHGDESNTLEFLFAAFLIVVQPRWYFSASGWTEAQDKRFPKPSACNWNGAWGETVFPYVPELYDRPLGPPLGPAKEVSPLVWERRFEQATVRLEASCAVAPRNCSSIRWHANDSVFVGLKTDERNITQCVGGPCRPGRDRCLWDTPTDKARYAFHLADATCGINDPNGPFYDSRHGMYHLMYQDHLAEPERISGVPDQGASMTGPGWGHWASRDFVHWTQLPVAIWNDKWWDASAVYSGSATIVNGDPVIVYPVSVPLDLDDPFLTNWTKDGPRMNGTANPILTRGVGDDPSTAWRTEAGEWTFIGNDVCSEGKGKPGGAPLYGTMDWKTFYKKGCTSLSTGDCPTLFPLPELTPGSEVGLTATQRAQLPSYVHKCGDKHGSRRHRA